jgi:hypothetical protein
MAGQVCCAALEFAFTSHDYPALFKAVFFECPWCGHVIPESDRDRYLIQPTVEDRSDLRERLRRAKTFDEVVRRLGHPDHTGTVCGPVNKPWKRWAQYSRLWSSLVYVVGEQENGGRGSLLSPQIRRPDPEVW